MKLQQLSLYNFRSYAEQTFEFSDKVTIITGPNGAGKTNILEAVYVLLRGKSFRDADDELIRFGEEWWRVVGKLGDQVREVRYEAGQPRPKQLIVNDVSKGSFTSRQQLPVVLFEPDDLSMIHGTPGDRRRYIDDLLGKLHAPYLATLARYERALRQRNNLLRKSSSLATLRDAVFVWDIALAEYGNEVQTRRRELISELSQNLSEEYSIIAKHTHRLTIEYLSKATGGTQQLATLLAHSLEKDSLIGTTRVGPHRDDIQFFLDGQPVKQTASRGEVRTLVLALKLLEAKKLEKATANQPIIILDDVFSELDKDRQRFVEAQEYQTIVTTTHAPRGKWQNIDLN